MRLLVVRHLDRLFTCRSQILVILCGLWEAEGNPFTPHLVTVSQGIEACVCVWRRGRDLRGRVSQLSDFYLDAVSAVPNQ
jgi:hypothetical protein